MNKLAADDSTRPGIVGGASQHPKNVAKGEECLSLPRKNITAATDYKHICVRFHRLACKLLEQATLSPACLSGNKDHSAMTSIS